MVNIALGKKHDARKDFAKCIKMGTPNQDAHINLAQLSVEVGQVDFALDVLDRADKCFPDTPGISISRIHILRSSGRIEAALRDQLEFARTAISKRRNDDPGYVKSVLRANRLAAKHRPYDAAADSRFHTSIRNCYRVEVPTPTSEPALPATPIFIVGLPRSGTTLLERMISQGDGIAGLGEVALFNRFTGRKLIADTSIADALPELRQAYAGFQSVVGPAQWTVDKMPTNYAHLGWINAAMPEARIILLRRDVRDVALSMFENYFDDSGQNFTFEEQRIRHRLQLFEETVTDWRTLGAEMLEVHYEDLVRAPEATLQTISDYCDLPFDPAMLNSAENNGSIRTVSSTQARQGVNTRSLARWERYRELLPKVFGG